MRPRSAEDLYAKRETLHTVERFTSWIPTAICQLGKAHVHLPRQGTQPIVLNIQAPSKNNYHQHHLATRLKLAAPVDIAVHAVCRVVGLHEGKNAAHAFLDLFSISLNFHAIPYWGGACGLQGEEKEKLSTSVQLQDIAGGEEPPDTVE